MLLWGVETLQLCGPCVSRNSHSSTAMVEEVDAYVQGESLKASATLHS